MFATVTMVVTAPPTRRQGGAFGGYGGCAWRWHSAGEPGGAGQGCASGVEFGRKLYKKKSGEINFEVVSCIGIGIGKHGHAKTMLSRVENCAKTW